VLPCPGSHTTSPTGKKDRFLLHCATMFHFSLFLATTLLRIISVIGTRALVTMDRPARLDQPPRGLCLDIHRHMFRIFKFFKIRIFKGSRFRIRLRILPFSHKYVDHVII
jgi:hypothetical protein